MDKKKAAGLRPWIIVFVALLDDIAVVALIFLILWALDVTLPPPLLIIVILALVALVFFLHRAIVRTLKKRLVTGAEGMIGTVGKAMETMNPAGMVVIRGEYWKAACRHGRIEKGSDVEVVGIKGLELEVRKRENE